MRNRKLLYILPTFVIITAVAAFGYIYSCVSKWDGKIYPNCFIEDNEVSGLTVNEAKTLISGKNQNMLSKKIKIAYEQKEYSVTYGDIHAAMDLENSINTAFNYGKDLTFLKKFTTLKSSNENKYNIEVKYDKESVRKFVAKVKEDIDRLPVNASISKIQDGSPQIVKETVGKKLDEEKLYNDIISSILYSSQDEAVITPLVEEDKPRVTESDLKHINSLVSSKTTFYSAANVGRAENIAIAASKLSGKLIMPGEEFSFNKETGARTLEMGFKGAPVIIKGKLVDGVAGGVCQVSTTLYNAVIKLGIRSQERRNHSLAPAYIEPGFDATVSEHIDYKFKNTSNYPLYIESKVGKGNLTFNIYSNAALSEVKYKLVNEVVEVLEPETTYNHIDTIPKGAVEKVQDPIKGYKVKVYLVAIKNGKEISRELLSKDNYKKVDGIYNIGI